MNKLSVIILAAVVGAVVAAYGTVKLTVPAGVNAPAEAKKESVYDRVMRTGTIRCGYITAPPYFSIDTNTGEKSGIIYDIMEKIGRDLSLKIEWVEEVSMAHMFEGFETGRYDSICQAMAELPERARGSDFTMPLFYNGTFVYARSDEDRFQSLEDIKKIPVKIAVIEGEYLNITVKEDFPNATAVVLPQMTDVGQVLLHVTTKKTDVSIQSPEIVDEFLKQNPNSIKRVSEIPVRVLGSVFSIPRGEYRLKRMLDTSIMTLLNTGFIDRTIAKYSKPEFFLPVGRPYDVNAGEKQ